MDDWHRRVAGELMAGTPSRRQSEAANALEIAFGKARGAIAYVLEFARAHRIAAAGNLAGDDVWIKLGDARVRLTLNRREEHLLIHSHANDARVRVRWDEENRALVDDDGLAHDPAMAACGALDALLTQWRANPAKETFPAASLREFEDEPTKG